MPSSPTPSIGGALRRGRGLPLFLLALVVLAMAASVAGAGGSGMTREQHMKAKRAFDRAKHSPSMNEDPDDVIEYRAADGTTKTMSRKELEAKLQQQQAEGLPQMGPDGSLTKQQEGRATVEELREKDPFLARVVDAGKYAISRLQAEGVVGQGARLKSLHSIDDDGEGIEENPKELHLQLIAVDGDKERTFEVRLETGYLSEALEVTGPGPNDKTRIPLTLSAPSSSSGSAWKLLLAYSPVPPSLLLMSGGVAVLLMGVTLVALGGFGTGGTGGKAD